MKILLGIIAIAIIGSVSLYIMSLTVVAYFTQNFMTWLFSDNSPFLDFIANLTMAYLTGFIPIGIALLGDYFLRDETIGDKFNELDRRLILDYIFQIKYFPFVLLAIYLTPFLWHWESIRPILVIISTSGLIILANNVFLRVYHWIKGDKNKFRAEYLNQLKDTSDFVPVWQSVWTISHHETRNVEGQFFTHWAKHINNLFTKQDFETVVSLISDMTGSLEIRKESFFSVRSENLPVILGWHFLAWSIPNNEQTSLSWAYEISPHINKLLRKYLEYDFKYGMPYQTFQAIQTHIRQHIQNTEYITSFFTIFYETFFEKVPILNHRTQDEIWQSFPNEWKVSEARITGENPLIPNISLARYLQWIETRIASTAADSASNVGNLTRNLFPNIDPENWVHLLIFQYIYTENVRGMVEDNWNLGYIARRPIIGTGSVDETNEERLARIHRKAINQYQQELKNTFKLVYSLPWLANTYSHERLEQYLEELTQLDTYPENSTEFKRVHQLTQLFKDMLAFLERSEPTEPPPLTGANSRG